MSQGVVLDASVALKLVLQEEFSGHAEALVRSSIEQNLPISGPPHLFSEVANALHQRGRRGDLTDEEAHEALAKLLGFPIQQAQPDALYDQALTFTQRHKMRSLYDCLYVVLAQILDAELWTADRNLINALGGAASWVRWIGDYPLPKTSDPET